MQTKSWKKNGKKTFRRKFCNARQQTTKQTVIIGANSCICLWMRDVHIQIFFRWNCAYLRIGFSSISFHPHVEFILKLILIVFRWYLVSAQENIKLVTCQTLIVCAKFTRSGKILNYYLRQTCDRCSLKRFKYIFWITRWLN